MKKQLGLPIAMILLFLSPVAYSDTAPDPGEKGLTAEELALLKEEYRTKLNGRSWTIGCRQSSGEPFYNSMDTHTSSSHFTVSIQIHDNSDCNNKLFTFNANYKYDLKSEIDMGSGDYALGVKFLLTSFHQTPKDGKTQWVGLNYNQFNTLYMPENGSFTLYDDSGAYTFNPL